MTPPRELASHVLGPRLAVGGMAEIYEARPIGGGDLVVLKVLLPQYASDAEIVRMLEHEGRLMQRVAGPGLVRVLEVHARGPAPCLVLEHVDGVSASAIMDALRARAEPVDAAMALALVLPLLDALERVHEARDDDGSPLGIVHRDVTPHNVLVRRDGAVLLGDFGIARSALRAARTRTGVIRGKLRYLAPEQATGSSVDARTDLYGVGLLLFELLAGAPYLDGSSEIELLRVAETPTFRPASELAPVDPRLDRALERLLARFPEERPASATAARRLLEPIAREHDLEAGRRAWAAHVNALVPPRRAVALVAPRARRSRAPWLAAGAAAGLGALGTAWLAQDWTDDQTVDLRGHQTSETASERPSDVEPRPAAPRERPDAPSAHGEPERAGADAVASVPRRADGPAEPRDTPPPRAFGRDRLARAEPSRPLARTEAVPTPPPPAEAVQDLEPARARLRALRATLVERGVLDSDLSPSQRARLREVDRAIELADARAAARALDEAHVELSAVVVDEVFVRRKLDRVDARIRAARARGADTAAIERTSALALQDLLEGRYDATNRRLNRILAVLPAR